MKEVGRCFDQGGGDGGLWDDDGKSELIPQSCYAL